MDRVFWLCMMRPDRRFCNGMSGWASEPTRLRFPLQVTGFRRCGWSACSCTGSWCFQRRPCGEWGCRGQMVFTLSCVLFVGHFFHPVYDFTVEVLLDRDMGHSRKGSGAMPVPLA